MLTFFVVCLSSGNIKAFAQPSQPTTDKERGSFSGEKVSAMNFCGQWEGKLSGNDCDVHVIMKLQCQGNKIKGSLFWNSPISGTNTRAVSGFFPPEISAVTLKDDGLVSTSPEPNWRFCRIDRYDVRLTENGQRLQDKYRSAACNDIGTFDLHKLSETPKQSLSFSNTRQ